MSLRRFITLEGGEGSGKSTQALQLAQRLSGRGMDAVKTREPGGSDFAEAIRAALLAPRNTTPGHLAQALAFNAARADHLDETIRPALDGGRFVICDRFSDSTLAYQCYAGDLPLETAARLDELVVKDTVPGLTVILDLDPRVGLERARARRRQSHLAGGAANPVVAADMFEARELEFHERLRSGYLEIASRYPERCVVVEASRSPDEIADEIWYVVSQRFGLL